MLENFSQYVSKNVTSAAGLESIVNSFLTPIVPKPVEPESKDDVEIGIFNKDVKGYVRKRNTIKDNINKLYLIV